MSINFIKTPQTTLGSEYIDENSIVTTEKICSEIHKYDFDIVLLSCGVYGCPIINYVVKNFNNKSVIYLGSLIYTIFGIYSKGIPIPNYDFINKEEFMEVDDFDSDTCYWANHSKMQYWIEVKQEINKL